MNGKVVIRFVPPPPVVDKNSSGKVVRTQHWDVEKMIAALQENLAPQVRSALKVDIEVEVVEAKASDIRFEGYKPPKVGGAKEAIGELIGDTMGELDIQQYLQP